MLRYSLYLFAGIVFGFTLIKSEVASWYRIQEMFHFQSFHMYGVIMTAVLTSFVCMQVMKRFLGKASLEGTPMEIPKKKPGTINYLAGGMIFGLGWGVIGLCPGPIFALVGSGSIAALLVLGGALHGTWLYGAVKDRLPH